MEVRHIHNSKLAEHDCWVMSGNLDKSAYGVIEPLDVPSSFYAKAIWWYLEEGERKNIRILNRIYLN